MRRNSCSIFRSLRGFSLLEIMTVVAIIALLAATAIPSVSEYQRRTRGSRSSQNLRTIQSSLDLWENDHGGPVDLSSGDRATGGTEWFALNPKPAETDKAYVLVSRYTKVTSSLWQTPQAKDDSETTYYWKVFSKEVDGVEVLQGFVGCGYNGEKLYEPRFGKLSSPEALLVNGYEDMGNLPPGGASDRPPMNR